MITVNIIESGTETREMMIATTTITAAPRRDGECRKTSRRVATEDGVISNCDNFQ
jgi:hypothetical protein